MSTALRDDPRPPAGSTIAEAVELMRGRRTAVLTGAGLSTDSGIPDYRGEGAPKRNPMTFQQFRSEGDDFRRRYWAGGHLGWKAFSSARPNDGHAALADLEAAGVVGGLVTQNVDGLHERAGSRRVVDLHGSLDRVLCLDCGQAYARSAIADRISAENPWLDLPDAVELNPDGDAQVHDVDRFRIPVCSVCGGMLKPDVVFFGELVPTERFREAGAIVSDADVLLIAGSSLAVNSGIRLLEIARRSRMPIVILNRGTTKGDTRATVRLEGGTSEILRAIATELAS
ncbi:Sir2 family NAD-dependent protein deacetylase [Clavibacter michiganensis]|uniref:protein acetyllysine N-acetyltransferase n=1 Tax=Clavibacter michiganensis subsp. michiganensis (strain NCPPB 382) TaxID=443906 RepID=A5CRQ3_CLAM3|nr:Sir2 family NAD-dependent protein deacetylase [Clavibacter michiganensis]MBF4636968.1 NAD-dependent deacetylase [Clavibacter michiganensis subsp. michiganensis]MBW8026732.1 NAD-dependent deacetylase [Clavibacter michiganensis subsp. michiganensis]MDO4017661.1 Sir2 family NAD-dependent protein deacetylase [Clavibacter michiganensis]MDO4026327.1 Sir2 family NAD-dependent protein deacetylase [Clavibacter michiganensis]MDO4028576.1 Sir2 family NAD-dependent protein deacetylase [Clavibacter mich